MIDTDLSSQITQLRRSGANVLMMFALPKQTIGGFVAANRLGWRPLTYVTSVSVDPAVMKIVQATTGNKAGENAVTVQWMKDSSNPANANDPAVRLYKQIMRRHAPGRNVDEVVHLYGMAVAYSMVKVLEAAGRNPTRASVLRAATHTNHRCRSWSTASGSRPRQRTTSRSRTCASCATATATGASSARS